MEEIKVGEYMRLKNGKIKQIKQVEKIDLYKLGKLDGYETHIYFETDGFPMVLQQNEELELKHSFDIKDLVQAGDIILYNVNSKMTDIEIVKEHIDARTQKKTLRVGLWSLEQVKIKEILTKEQFNQMKYIVGDESNE